MHTQKIEFPEQQALCVFPDDLASLGQALSTLGLKDSYPVIVLIGGEIQEPELVVTRIAIDTLAKIANETNALVICGGTNMGIMAEIGKARWRNIYEFPLVGITPEALVTWPGGPHSTNFLWWGKKRWPLANHYSHFILVPGAEFGDESPWIVDAATLLSKDHPSVTILMNGGNVSRKDIELSIEYGRPIIALSGTGRLANELAGEPNRNALITVVPASAENRMIEAVRSALSIDGEISPLPTSRTTHSVGDAVSAYSAMH
jgi:hypothetical protein